MPLIILDGPDCCGKTTLASKFKEKYHDKCSITHLSYKMAGKMGLYHLAAILHATRKQPDRLHILDRSWISEEIYGHVYRNGPENLFLNRMIHRIALKYSAVYILCIPHDVNEYLQFFLDVYKERNEMYDMDDQVPRIWDCFQSIITANSNEKLQGYSGFLQSNKTTIEPFAAPHWMVYDMFYDNPEETIEHSILIASDLFYRQVPQFNSPKNQNGGGHAYGAKLLLLGDHSYGNYRRCNYPFVGAGSINQFLAQQLDLAGIAEEELLWMNVFNPNKGKKIEHLKYLFSFLACKSNPPWIVAMGSEVDEVSMEWAKKYGLESYLINHPAWYATFNNQTDLLAQTLMQMRNEYDQSLLPKESKAYVH